MKKNPGNLALNGNGKNGVGGASPETFLGRIVYFAFPNTVQEDYIQKAGPCAFHYVDPRTLLNYSLRWPLPRATTPSSHHTPMRSHPLAATPSWGHTLRWPRPQETTPSGDYTLWWPHLQVTPPQNTISFHSLYLKVPSLVYNQSLIWFTGFPFWIWKDILYCSINSVYHFC